MRDRGHTPFMLPLLGILLASGFLGGCGEGGGDSPEFPKVAVNEPAADLVSRGAVVSGTVRFDGPLPRLATVEMGSDAVCKASNTGTVHTEAIVVGADRGLRDVLVHVVKGLETYTFALVEQVAELDQDGCVYKPHVLAVRTHQPVVFKNSDNTAHNINTKSDTPQGFNKTTSSKGSTATWQFRKPELDIRTKCDIHPWMEAWIHVLDHPYFAVSAETGAFELPKGLPPGTYTLEARHPTLGAQSQEITIGEGAGTASMTFTFKR
jgi:plastocyanin